MREIKKGDTTFQVRGLTRGELKQLRCADFDLSDLHKGNAEEAVDRVFDIIFSESEILTIDGLPNIEAMDLWTAVLAETYGSQDEEKNLQTSGPGTQTPSE